MNGNCRVASFASYEIEVDERLSVHEKCVEEAQKHKWIESEKAGRDLGDFAIKSWVRRHWNGFLRQKWIEHLEGKTFWIELDHDDFGLLNRGFSESPLLPVIVQKIKAGEENLNIIVWAIDCRHPMRDVMHILYTLDMNSRRIECQLETRLSQAG